MRIHLIKPLTEKQASLLSSINITVSDKYLDVPDTRGTYCKISGYNYQIYCHDDKTPVASLFIKDELWDSDQIVNINKEQIAIAKEKLASNSTTKSAAYPDYEERCKKVSSGDNSCLFEAPFSELRFDEQNIVRETSYQREGGERFYPLSKRGLEIVELIRDTRKQLDFIKYNSSFFAGREDAQRSYWETHRTKWNDLLDGKHQLTTGMQADQIKAYFQIARNEKVSADFQEPANAATKIAQSERKFGK